MVFQDYLDQIVREHNLLVKVVNGDAFTDRKYENNTAKEIVGEILSIVRKRTKI
ncbi:MAG: hypothetical protein LBM02_08875 [Lachnospiraceae bacterium]|jgi:metallophosphoesterase superfamily enzyme|nr:hypothetical protein [Lachnospiraceae bacterium]